MTLENTISFEHLMALFVAMLLLAAVPSVSTLAVAARSAALGFRHGVTTALGIVFGDILFIFFSSVGLALIAEIGGRFFEALRYIAAAYLLILGLFLWRARSGTSDKGETIANASHGTSFLTGLFITLGDQKAFLFYVGFLPAFVNVDAMTALDVVLIIVAATVALLGTKLVYAWFGDRSRTWIGPRGQRWMNRLAGVMVAGVGSYMLWNAFTAP